MPIDRCPEGAIKRTSMHKLVEACTCLYKLLLVTACTSLYKFVQACTSLYKPVQACANLYQLVQAYTSLHKLAQACTSLHKLLQACASLFKLVQAISLYHYSLYQYEAASGRSDVRVYKAGSSAKRQSVGRTAQLGLARLASPRLVSA